MSGVIHAEDRFDNTMGRVSRMSEVVCLKCLHRMISVRPVGTPLKVLQCSQCGESGFVIETGEDFDIACTGDDGE